MDDVLTPQQRKYCMSQIKAKNIKPELKLRKALWKKGYRYRINHKIYGKPDLVFLRKKIAVFIDGCFWHGCPEHYSEPKTNNSFWKTKIQKNKTRDDKVNQTLTHEGWRVIRFWEHQIKNDIQSCIKKISQIIG